LPADLSASSRYYARDVVEPPWEVDTDGTIAVPIQPGIGVEVDEEFLDTVTVKEQTFSA
jgi:O-succinylbenzoate synthase